MRTCVQRNSSPPDECCLSTDEHGWTQIQEYALPFYILSVFICVHLWFPPSFLHSPRRHGGHGEMHLGGIPMDAKSGPLDSAESNYLFSVSSVPLWCILQPRNTLNTRIRTERRDTSDASRLTLHASRGPLHALFSLSLLTSFPHNTLRKMSRINLRGTTWSPRRVAWMGRGADDCDGGRSWRVERKPDRIRTK